MSRNSRPVAIACPHNRQVTRSGAVFRLLKYFGGLFLSTGLAKKRGSFRRLTSGHYFYIFGNMEISQAVNGLAALAQESRLAIFRLLVRQGPQGIAAGALGDRLGIPPATLSFHLKALTHAGLVKNRTAGRFVYYSANFAAMNALLEFLTQDCCGGRPDLCLPAELRIELPKPGIKSRAPSRIARRHL